MSDNDESTIDEISLTYHIIADENNKILYVKFSGFETVEQVNDLATFLEPQLPLLLFDSDVKH